MGYSEKDGQVVLTLSRDDYSSLIFYMGAATGVLLRDSPRPDTQDRALRRMLEFLNRLNQGNPNYTPYQVGEKKL